MVILEHLTITLQAMHLRCVLCSLALGDNEALLVRCSFLDWTPVNAASSRLSPVHRNDMVDT